MRISALRNELESLRADLVKGLSRIELQHDLAPTKLQRRFYQKCLRNNRRKIKRIGDLLDVL